MEHSWSGWPGAHCLKCGAEHAMESAITDGWYDPFHNTWLSDLHEEYITLLDANCAAKMDEASFKKVMDRCVILEGLITQWEHNSENVHPPERQT